MLLCGREMDLRLHGNTSPDDASVAFKVVTLCTCVLDQDLTSQVLVLHAQTTDAQSPYGLGP